jgi:hypothetical protein
MTSTFVRLFVIYREHNTVKQFGMEILTLKSKIMTFLRAGFDEKKHCSSY